MSEKIKISRESAFHYKGIDNYLELCKWVKMLDHRYIGEGIKSLRMLNHENVVISKFDYDDDWVTEIVLTPGDWGVWGRESRYGIEAIRDGDFDKIFEFNE